MRCLWLGMLIGVGCTPPASATRALPSPPAERPSRVTRWLIVTQGDQPAQCDEAIHLEEGPFPESALGVPLEIIHLNEMSTVGLRSLSYTVDGHCTFSWTYDRYRGRRGQRGGRSEPNQLNVARLRVPPGEHEVAVVAEYAPPPEEDGSAAPYVLRLRGSYAVELGGASRLYVTGYERGDLSTRVEERPGLRFEIDAMRPRPIILKQPGER